jgi:membrane associated rhomboid family serine protease
MKRTPTIFKIKAWSFLFCYILGESYLVASGAVSAVVYAFIVMFPFNKMSLLFIPIEFPAWVFGIGYLALEIYLDKNSKSNIAHSAHYFGGIYGLILTILLHPEFVLKYFI